MFDKNFLSQLSILYVEDDEVARSRLSKILKRLFKNVIEASNGQEGYEIFQKSKNTKEIKIDLILSDINMPKLDGISMLEKIREDNDDIPIIFTTARNETEYLLKAISLNANHYILKPINKEDVILKIQKVCEKKYYEELVKQKNNELKEYLKIINSLASITKMNEKGEITFANEHFLSISSYTKEELLNKNFEEILNLNIDKTILEKLWQTIKSKEAWRDDLKYKDKFGNDFYIKSTIFYTNNDEYINIGFLSTNEVNEKREFRKRVIQNIKDKNIELHNINQEKNSNEDKINNYEALIMSLKEQLENEKEKNKKANSQIKHYETEILNSNENTMKNLKSRKVLFDDLNRNLSSCKMENQNSLKNIDHLQEQLLDAKVQIEKLEERVQVKNKRIDNLSQVLDLREHQLKKIDPLLLEKNL